MGWRPLSGVRSIPRRLVLVLSITGLLALPAIGQAAEWPLSGYWPMYEGRGDVVRDISGVGNHGTLGATRTADPRDAQWIRGLFGVGSALKFDGNDYVAIADDPTLRQQRLTVEAWVRRAGSPGPYRYVVSKGGDGCEAASYGMYSSANGGIAFYVYDGSRFWRSPQGATSIWDDRWHHVAGTYDGARVHLYVDGLEVGTGTPFAGLIKYDQPYGAGAIGAYRGSCDLTMSGSVDEVRIWRQALSIPAIWSRIKAGLDREPAAALPQDAFAWYVAGS